MQILGVWRVLDPALQVGAWWGESVPLCCWLTGPSLPLARQALHGTAVTLLRGFRWWGLRHIPRAANHAADALANEAMDRRRAVRREVPAGGLAAVAAASRPGGASVPERMAGGPPPAAPTASPYFAAAAAASFPAPSNLSLAGPAAAAASAPVSASRAPLPAASAPLARSVPAPTADAAPLRHGHGSMDALVLAAAAAADALPERGVAAARAAPADQPSALGRRARGDHGGPAAPAEGGAAVVDLSHSPPLLGAHEASAESGSVGADDWALDGGAHVKRPRR